MNVLKASIAFLALPLVAALPAHAQRKRFSPHETISAAVGPKGQADLITIVYGRPYTKDPKTGEPRKIWGGLVPWDKADRLGADEATLFLAEKPIVVGQTTLPAGAYTLYIIASEAGTSKLAFSSHLGKWGIPVDEAHDVARVDLKKDSLDQPVDQLTLAIEKDGSGGGVLKISWEKTQFSVPLTVPKS